MPCQDLVEKVVILRQAVERSHGAEASAVGTMLAQKMSQYASLLASQGSLETALTYLPENTNQVSRPMPCQRYNIVIRGIV